MLIPIVLIPIVYGLCGSFLKIADFLGEKNKKFQYLTSGICSFLFGLLLTTDSYSSSIFFGIILGVFLASKVDSPNLIFGFIMTFLIVIILGFKEPISWLFSVFSLISFLDEVGHDKRVNLKFGFLFRYRFLLKITNLILIGFKLIEFVVGLNFLCFDFSYDLLDHLIKNWNK